MAIIKAKPTSPGRRFRVQIKEDLHKGRPEKTLVESKKRTSGRNNNGHITVRHRGGGHKRLYRITEMSPPRAPNAPPIALNRAVP
jgi:large subunit ribosomal protein L2